MMILPPPLSCRAILMKHDRSSEPVMFGKPVRLIDRKFLEDPRAYLLQSMAAIVALVVILYFVTLVTHAAIVAALGSSAFIVFAMPHYLTAEPRRLVGGHILGLVCGIVAYYVFLIGPMADAVDRMEWLSLVPVALSVGLSVLLMPVFDVEHPPAAGTALGIAIGGWRYETLLFVVIFAVSLAVVRKLLLRRLKDLV